MESYSDFAAVYDLLMQDVDYKKRCDYLLKLFKKFGETPTLLLDVACGTGGFSNLLALKGIEVIGIDMSEDMLAVARENAAEMGADVLYLCQKAEELDLYGTVDGAICCLDSINHITDKRNLQKAFDKISLFLENDCLFIFDANTEYKHRETLGNNTFIMDEDEVYCIWQNNFDPKLNLTDICLDFFIKDGENYIRSGEEFSERAYSKTELCEMLKKAGFKVEAVFDDMTELPLKETSERAIFVCKKI